MTADRLARAASNRTTSDRPSKPESRTTIPGSRPSSRLIIGPSPGTAVANIRVMTGCTVRSRSDPAALGARERERARLVAGFRVIPVLSSIEAIRKPLHHAAPVRHTPPPLLPDPAAPVLVRETMSNSPWNLGGGPSLRGHRDGDRWTPG
jgi:hypothetical protein